MILHDLSEGGSSASHRKFWSDGAMMTAHATQVPNNSTEPRKSADPKLFDSNQISGGHTTGSEKPTTIDSRPY
jgi:hypothetical protein